MLQTIRDWLAIVVIVISVIALAVVGCIAIASATAGEQSKTAQLIFSALLPLIGTWVGTVLAFYFSKENYQVAADFAKETLLSANEKLSPIPVRDAMIGVHRITAFELVAPNPSTFDGAKLDDIKKQMKRYKRIPVLDGNRRVVAVIHHEPLVSFLFDATNDDTLKKALNNKAVSDMVCKDVKDHQKSLYDDFTRLFAFVSESASLAEAKKAMESINRCQDVFVTATGSPTESIVGWVTNNEITDRLRA